MELLRGALLDFRVEVVRLEIPKPRQERSTNGRALRRLLEPKNPKRAKGNSVRQKKHVQADIFDMGV